MSATTGDSPDSGKDTRSPLLEHDAAALELYTEPSSTPHHRVAQPLNYGDALDSTPQAHADVVATSVEVNGDDDDDDAGSADTMLDHGDTAQPLDLEKPPMRSAIFTMTPLFMGYASLITLQDNIKKRLGIHDDSSAGSYEFSFAVSWLYLGNLIFRLMHNIVFSRFSPRTRVCIAYSCMTGALLTLAFAFYIFNSKNVAWVFVAYLMGGVGIGTFESNLISCITPLGHRTKVWAQLGISFGFNGVSIGAFLLYTASPNDLPLQFGTYVTIAVANIAGMIFFLCRIPNIEFESTAQSITLFWSDLRRFREWVPKIGPYAIPMVFNMAGLGFFSAVQLYIYNVQHVPLWWGSRTTIPLNAFRAIYNFHSLVGDASGRKLAYARSRLSHPAWFLIFTVIGGGMIMSKVALIAPLGMFFVMFANGSMYATTTKFIDIDVPQRFNLIALSFWLFAGDIGSFVGANVVNGARVAVGEVPTAAPRRSS